MSTVEDFRARTRATWAAGNWDDFSVLIAPVGQLVLERAAVADGMRLLDVGTGTGGNIAIPAAQRGATVVGMDITPELLVHARRRAGEAGVEVEWVEGDAQELPFPDASFDRVISTFGAMFAPDHKKAAAELVRVSEPSGRVLMTTWVNDGFAGELFRLTGSFMPAPPAGVEPPELWGDSGHVEEAFGSAGARASLSREAVAFTFPSIDATVARYASDLGPFVMAKTMLEPAGRWEEFLAAFADLVRRFNTGGEDGVRLNSEYYLITAER